MRFVSGAVWVVGALTLAACGGYSNDSTDYTPPDDNSVSTATELSLTSSGVSNHALTVAAGAQVKFVNNDSSPHQMTSDPHPTHGDCPELNGPTLQPGESFTATMTGSRSSCGFHDHLNPENAGFKGTITISGGTYMTPMGNPPSNPSPSPY